MEKCYKQLKKGIINLFVATTIMLTVTALRFVIYEPELLYTILQKIGV